MTEKLRIATFNCENLFSRPKIFGTSEEKSKMLLDYVSELNQELNKQTFDHDRIKALKKKLSGYATINDARGKHTSAKGRADWFGWVELSRGKAKDEAVMNTARVIADVDADVVCLVEVENRPLLMEFHNGILAKKFIKSPAKRYKHIMLIDGNDGRGIDVALMSHHPIGFMCSHVDEEITYNGKKVKTFSRDCLEAVVHLSQGHDLVLLLNHLKSMGYSPKNDPQSRRRRKGQAARVAEIASQYDLDQTWLVVAGDMNSDPADWSVGPLVEHGGLYNVNLTLPEDQRGTYRTGNKQLDYILVSKPLKDRLREVKVERRGVYTRGKKWQPYPEVTGRRTEASDHAAVVAEFGV